jgi:hypothetical protein
LYFVIEAFGLLALADGVLEERDGGNCRSSEEKHLLWIENKDVLNILKTHTRANGVPVELRNYVSLGNFAYFIRVSEVP